MIKKIDNQKGVAQFLVIAVMALMVLGIPTATKLVQQNQENRSKATSDTSYTSSNTISGLEQNKICVTVKTDDLSSTTDKDNPELLCKSGRVWQYRMMKPTCIGVKCENLPQNLKDNYYRWYCVINTDLDLDESANTAKPQINKDAFECRSYSSIEEVDNPTQNSSILETEIGTTTSELNQETELIRKSEPKKNTLIPANSIKVSPPSLKMKVGQTQNLTYIIAPSNSTDTVKWSVSQVGLVNIQKNTPKCAEGSKCIGAPGINHLEVTALKVGTVKIKLITSSNKSTEATVIITDNSQTTPTPSPIPISSAYLYFDPSKKSLKVGETFTLTAGVNSGSNEINGLTVYGKYDSSKLELISMEKSTSKPFGDIGDCHNLTNNDYDKFNFRFTCYTTSTYDQMKVKGELVRLTFKAKSAGLAKVQFVCNKDFTEPTSTISNSVDHKNFTNCDKNINANILITEESTVINGSCGSVKYSALTETSDKDNPQILCKTGKVSEFSKMTPNCSSTTSTNCPPSFYSWKCQGSNGGKSVKCSIKAPATHTIPATGIKVTPTSLELKIGQTAKISYVLTPKDTTNPVYQTIVGPKDLVKMTEVTTQIQGVKSYTVTALKPGSVKIYFRTSSGKSATSNILINK